MRRDFEARARSSFHSKSLSWASASEPNTWPKASPNLLPNAFYKKIATYKYILTSLILVYWEQKLLTC